MEIEFPFPRLGLNKNWAKSKQPQETSPDLQNVRPYDVQDNRVRGGQRPGLVKVMEYEGDAPDRPILALTQITTTSYEID